MNTEQAKRIARSLKDHHLKLAINRNQVGVPAVITNTSVVIGPNYTFDQIERAVEQRIKAGTPQDVESFKEICIEEGVLVEYV